MMMMMMMMMLLLLLLLLLSLLLLLLLLYNKDTGYVRSILHGGPIELFLVPPSAPRLV